MGMSKEISPWDSFGNDEAGENILDPISIKNNDSISISPAIEIQDHDVLLGRGKSNANHIGNVLFQAMITENCDSYMNATTQKSKKETCENIMKMVRGRFLRLDVDGNCWIEIDDETVRIKVAQAFQYRQRRQVQKEPPDGSTHDEQTDGSTLDERNEDRKRKLSTASFIPEASNVADHQNMRIPEPLESDNITVTLDELRWVLGSQSALPPQQQHHASNPSNIGYNNFSYGNLDDYAIGMPATMRSQPNEQIQQFVQPATDMNDFVERMRRSRILLTAAANEADSTASFLMQSHFQQPDQFHHQQHLQQQQSARFQNFNLSHLDHNNYNASFPNAVVPAIYASQAAVPDSLQQSGHFQGVINPPDFDLNGKFQNHGGTLDAALAPKVSSFDVSASVPSLGNFPQEFAGETYNSTHLGQHQRQDSVPNMEHNIRPTFQHPLFIDQLSMDENEIAQSDDNCDGA